MSASLRVLVARLLAVVHGWRRARRSTVALLSLLALSPLLAVGSAVIRLADRPTRHGRRRASASAVPGERGQATAEYALVLLGVAAIALLLAAWAARSGKIGQLFDAVIDQLIGKAR